jgi:hypothetical protein
MEKNKSTTTTSTNNNNNSKQVESSLDQKIQYLEKLFLTIEEEQSELLSFLKKEQKQEKNTNKNVYETFIQNINNAEIEIRNGYTNINSKAYKQGCNHYNHALTLMTPYYDYTKLFNPLLIEIKMKRSLCYYELGKMDECLVDTTFLLEEGRLGEQGSNGGGINVEVLKLHAKALVKVGRDEEAKESIGKLSLICPEDEEVSGLMTALKL